MKVLVTGGSGAVGRRLLADLKAEGHEVVSLTRATSPTPPSVSTTYAFDELRELCQGVDTVVHLAWRRSPSTRVDSWNANFSELDNLLEAASTCGVARFIGASSISVYSGGRLPWNETTPSLPGTAYGVSKLAAEHMISLRSREMSTLSLRLAHVYTDDEDNNYAVNSFIRKAEAGEPITVTGDRARQRDMVYVQDVSDAFRSAMSSAATGVLNIGSGRPVSMGEIASAAVEAFGGQSELTIEETTGSGAGSTHLDLTKAAESIQYRPKFDIRSGMKDIAERRSAP